MGGKKEKRSEGSRALAEAILQAYKPTTVAEMQEAMRDIFGPLFEAMLQGEMDGHLGYPSNARGEKENANRRNGYTDKTIKTSMGDIAIRTPRDREGSFTPQIIPKRSRDVSGISAKPSKKSMVLRYHTKPYLPSQTVSLIRPKNGKIVP